MAPPGDATLEAQREACEAYIRSQSHEGWKLIPDRFDDGGFSGGNMDRPALANLMALVREGRVDVIVIYKIDRLTRSLTDFARLAETFDEHGVSFVSVTQQFNTTTSMGRLMLNVLLSFAQFEREITGERIRDKIAASKKKGIWMGGPVPMGYSVKDRQLIINEDEAKSVRRVFELYLDESNVPALLERLTRECIRTPVRTSAKGKQSGGRWFTRGHVYKLLSSPLYIGRIAHKGSSHAGQHEAIVDIKTWDAVQARLATNTQGERQRRKRATAPQPLLADLLVTSTGNRMIRCILSGQVVVTNTTWSSAAMRHELEAMPLQFYVQAQAMELLVYHTVNHLRTYQALNCPGGPPLVPLGARCEA